MSKLSLADKSAAWPILSAVESVNFSGSGYRVFEWPEFREDAHRMSHQDVTERIVCAISLLDAVISIDPETRGGIPVLIGTRVPIARLFAEVAAGRSIIEIADDKELDLDSIRQVFDGFAIYIGRSFSK